MSTRIKLAEERLDDLPPLDLRRIPWGLTPTAYKSGDEFKPFHPAASHVPPDYRDGWNRCWLAAAIDRAAAPAASPLAPEGATTIRESFDLIADAHMPVFGMRNSPARERAWDALHAALQQNIAR